MLIRLMGVKLLQEISRLIQPAILTGLSPVYKVIREESDMAVEVIMYMDGDEGMLAEKFIPGLCEYATKYGIMTQETIVHNSILIPFRKKLHDAVELEHQY